MKRFLLLFSGPPTPPDSSHEGWPEWFSKLGDALEAIMNLDEEWDSARERETGEGGIVQTGERSGEALVVAHQPPVLAEPRIVVTRPFTVLS